MYIRSGSKVFIFGNDLSLPQFRSDSHNDKNGSEHFRDSRKKE